MRRKCLAISQLRKPGPVLRIGPAANGTGPQRDSAIFAALAAQIGTVSVNGYFAIGR